MIPSYPHSLSACAHPRTIPGVFCRLGFSGLLALLLLLSVASAAFADEVISYRVQDGDTLLSLANRFAVNSDEIATVNGLTDPDVLSVGQLLFFREVSPANPFGLTVPDRRDDIAEDVQRMRGLTSVSGGLIEYPPLPPSLLKMIATIGSVSALQHWTAAPIRPSIIPAPMYSQFDSLIWSSSNCGPASLSMALGAIGISADQISLRHLANDQMGSYDPRQGMSWEALATAAHTNGAGTKGLMGGNDYRTWSAEDLKRELELGHPVLLLLRYRLLPDHATSSYSGDHYIVALGFDAQGSLVYNDPAGNVANGVRRRLTPAQLDDAWSNTWAGHVRTAMAVYG